MKMNHELFLISGPVEILGEGKGSLKVTRTGELKCYFFFLAGNRAYVGFRQPAFQFSGRKAELNKTRFIFQLKQNVKENGREQELTFKEVDQKITKGGEIVN